MTDAQGEFHELEQDVSSSPYFNEDLAPTSRKARTWSLWNIAALWIGMSVCVPTYMLAASLIAGGMTWWQAVGTVLLGNLVVLVPMIANAHAGTKFGIPFPVFLRASFGIRGSNVPALMRALVACGWFGIQTYIGGAALYALASVMMPGLAEGEVLGWLGLNPGQLVCFLLFWAINIGVIIAGIESIKFLETWSAPILLLIGAALLGWGIMAGGGLGTVLDRSEAFSQPPLVVNDGSGATGDTVSIALFPLADGDTVRAVAMRVQVVAADDTTALASTPLEPFAAQLQRPVPAGLDSGAAVTVRAQLYGSADGETPSSVLEGSVVYGGAAVTGGGQPFWKLFLLSLTAMVGFWATLSLNIPDFTRYARSQKDQMLGQLLGLPSTMTLFAFIGVAVTCAAVVVFKDIIVVSDAPWDPVQLLSRFEHPVVVIVSMLGLAIATLSTNIAANVVSPANDFSNLAPKLISFKTGGLLTGLIGILIMPWKLLATAGGYIFVWLIGYGTLLGPIGGILIADYYVVRRRWLHLPDLYLADGRYFYTGGFGLRTLAVLFISILVNLPGFLVAIGVLEAGTVPWILQEMYSYGFFVGFAIAFGLYVAVAKRPEQVS